MKMSQKLEGSMGPRSSLTQSRRRLMVCADASGMKTANQDYNEAEEEMGEKWLQSLVDHLSICQEVYGAG